MDQRGSRSGQATLVRRLVGPAAVAATFAALLAWTWRKWPDAVVDFGGELYVAWRVAEGEVLYRDLAYFTGPLSPHVNALWFRLFGTSLMTLALANIVLLVATTILLHRLAARLADRLAAAVATVLFLALCALALHQGAGNYNFVCPYSHETTHGTLLALAALNVLEAWLRSPRRWHAILLGALFGLVLLTKVEFSVALGLALLAGGLAARHERRSRVRDALLASAVALSILVAAFVGLALRMPPEDALRGVLGAWIHVGDSRLADFPLYRAAMGLFPLDHHLMRLAMWTVAWLAALGGAAWLARRAARPSTELLIGAAVSLGLLVVFRRVAWVDAFYPLPVFALVAIVWWWRRRRSDPEAPARLALAVLGLGLLPRILLNSRVQFYGFALAAPAVVAMAMLQISWLPAAIARRGGHARVVRAVALPLLTAVALGHLLPMAEGMSRKTVEVGAGPDAFLADWRGAYVARAAEAVARRCPEDGSALVLPEGAMINFLARRRSPTRYFNFMPPELVMFGEPRMLAALERDPPDVIVLVHKDTREYGLDLFGRDYAVALLDWVKGLFEPARLWSVEPGQRPLEPGTIFAVALLKRRN